MAELKDTNPKDMIGSEKLPLDLVPDSLAMYAALAFLEGATKYGAFNWRRGGARASIYVAALRRHLAKWVNGEECDPKTHVPHLASAIACLGILVDAQVCDTLVDDRPPRAPVGPIMDNWVSAVVHLKDMHRHINPKHHTEKEL